jgi:uncharacterized membrane protein YeaQ/YmgE (transglycosylase-associated protein family)
VAGHVRGVHAVVAPVVTWSDGSGDDRRPVRAGRRPGGATLRAEPPRVVDAVGMIEFILSLLAMGLVAGALGRWLVPGEDPMSVLWTMGLGITGSYVGGFLGWLILDHDLDEGPLQISGYVGSVIGAVLVLLVYNYVQGHRASSRSDV